MPTIPGRRPSLLPPRLPTSPYPCLRTSKLLDRPVGPLARRRVNEAILDLTSGIANTLSQRRKTLFNHAVAYLHSVLPGPPNSQATDFTGARPLNAYGTPSTTDGYWWQRLHELGSPLPPAAASLERLSHLRARADRAISALSKFYRGGTPLGFLDEWITDEDFTKFFPPLQWLSEVATGDTSARTLLTLAAQRLSKAVGDLRDIQTSADFSLPCTCSGPNGPTTSFGTVDTGAMLSLISRTECERIGLKFSSDKSTLSFNVVDAGNNCLAILGSIRGPTTVTLTSDEGTQVGLTFTGVNQETSLFVVDNLPCPLLLGLPILSVHDAILHTRTLTMAIGEHRFSPSASPMPGQQDRVQIVHAAADVELIPGYAHRVPLNIGHSTAHSRYFVGSSLQEELSGYQSMSGLLDDGATPCVILHNLTESPIILPSSQSLGTVVEFRQRRVFIVAHSDEGVESAAAAFAQRDSIEWLAAHPQDFPGPDLTDTEAFLPDPISPFSGPSLVEIAPADMGKELSKEGIRAMLSADIPPDKVDAFLTLLWQHRDVWTNSFSAQWDAEQFKIQLKPGASPNRARSFRFPHAQINPLRELINKWLEEGVIEPSNSPWCSSAFFVPKPHGGGLRFVVDYRVLNSNTVEDRFPLPEIQDVFTNFRGHEVFSTFDALSGFNQQSVHPDSRDYTSFVCPLGTFRSTRLSMGLRNGPASFQRGMMMMCNGLFGVNVYVDDVSVSNGPATLPEEVSPDGSPMDVWDLHILRISQFLERCTRHQLRLNPKKCIIGARSVKYLGYIISKDGLQPDPEKVAALDSILAPTNPQDIRIFLGLINYYRSFIRDCARLSLPLNDLLGKGVPFVWTALHQSSFEALRACLSEECLRCHYDPDVPLELYTDCSDFAMGAVLSQKVGSVDRVIAYFSRSLQAAERNYSVYQKECLAIVGSITYFHQYLAGQHFTVYTDHYSLASVLRWKDPPQRIARWIQILDQYHFTAVYKSGSSHANADALSRLESRYVRKELPGSLDHFPVQELSGVTTIPRLNNMLDDIIPALPEVSARTPLGTLNICSISGQKRPKTTQEVLNQHPEYSYIGLESLRILSARRTLPGILTPSAEEVINAIDSSAMPFEHVFQYLGRRFTDPDDNIEYVISDVYLNDTDQDFWAYRQPFDPTVPASPASKEPIYFDTILAYLETQPQSIHPDTNKQQLIDNEDEFRSSVVECIAKWTAHSLLLAHQVISLPDEDGVVHLYRRTFDRKTTADQLQLLLPDTERGLLMRRHLLYSCHEAAGHLHFDKFYAELKQRVWWPGMYTDAKAHARSCEACQERGTSRDRDIKGIPIGKLPRVYRPFDKIAVDMLGPLSSTKGGKEYILVAVDHFSRWVEAESYAKCPDAETVNQFMLSHFYFRHGAPRTIVADNGTNLTANRLNSYLFDAMGSRVRNVTAYHPQANGMVERVNKPICDILATFCTDEDGANWPEHLDAVIHVLNTSVHSTTGYTPFFLVHGREANRVIDHRLPRAWDARFPGKTWTDYALNLRRTLAVAERVASQNTDQVQSLYNAPRAFHRTQSGLQSVTPRVASKYSTPFAPGDWILVFTPVIGATNKDLSVRKLAKFWRGPFQIVHAISEVIYMVSMKGKEVPIHLSRLKRFFGRSATDTEPF